MVQLGLRAHDYGKNVPPDELAEILSKFKPDSIQLALAKALSCAPGYGNFSPGYARKVRQTLEKRGISIAVLGCYINPVHPDKNIRESQLRLFEDHLRYARDFGCALVGTETGSKNADCSFHPDTEKPETYDVLCSSIERLLKTAEKSGSSVAIEAVAHHHTISTVEKMKDILGKFCCPALKVIYDPVNLIPVTGLAETQELFFTRAFDAFGGDIAAVHAKDFRMESGKKNGALSAGTGDLDYNALLKIIMQRKPGIDILLEDTSPQTGAAAIKFIRGKASEIIVK